MFPKRKIRSKTPLDYAVRVLSRKDYFESEMFAKISEHFSEEEAAETIIKLKDYGYLDDTRCRKNLIVSRLRNGYGTYRIAAELREKGIDDDLTDIDELAAESCADRLNILREAIKRFLETRKADTPYDLRQKCMAHFYRKGHPLSDIDKILRQELEK